jgi:AcrR family transcriptional regulator
LKVPVFGGSTETPGFATNEEVSSEPNAAMSAGKPMRADALRNREKILEAAEEIFAVDGVTVPIDVVAERAGVGVGTLYRHFPSKEALYEAIIVMRVDDIIRTADVVVHDTEMDPSTALYIFLREFARMASAKKDLFEALEQSGVDIKAHFEDRVGELLSRMDVLRQRATEAGALRADVETEDIMNLVMGTCHAAAQSGKIDEVRERLMTILIAGLQSPLL